MTHPLQTELADARARVQAEVQQAQAELDQARSALAERPAESELLAAVTRASQKLAEATSSLGHLDGAASHAQRVADAADRARRVERRKAQRQRIVALGPVLDDAAAALVQHIQRMGPLLAAYDAAASEHHLLCVGLAREAELGLPYGRQHLTDQLLQLTDPHRDCLPEAVATALCDSGLGRVGPNLELQGVAPQLGRVEFQADPIGAYLKHTKSLRYNVKENLDRADQALAERDARAA